MTAEELKNNMNYLVSILEGEGLTLQDKRKVIAMAVQLGQNYTIENVREGMNIVFKEIKGN
jgi:hypothetical protein